MPNVTILYDETQAEPTDRAGLNRNHVGGIEHGALNPTLTVIAMVARGGNIGLSELFAPFPPSGRGG
jgi:hypothetical protein